MPQSPLNIKKRIAGCADMYTITTDRHADNINIVYILLVIYSRRAHWPHLHLVPNALQRFRQLLKIPLT